MRYVQIIYTKPGLMGYIENNQDGTLSRYTDEAGNTIKPTFDSIMVVSSDPNPKSWFIGEIINIISPAIAGVPESQITDANGNVQIIPAVPAIPAQTTIMPAMVYQQVSFLSGTVQGYQVIDDNRGMILTDANGITQTDDMLRIAGLTESHVVNAYAPTPAWGS